MLVVFGPAEYTHRVDHQQGKAARSGPGLTTRYATTLATGTAGRIPDCHAASCRSAIVADAIA